MKSDGKYILWTAVLAILFVFPDKLFSQWYAEAEYRFGVNKRTLSALEISQTNVQGAIAKPYSFGGYTVSAGYTFRPDSLNIALSTGISYLNSNSGNIMGTLWPYYPAYSTLKHVAVTADIGASIEYILKSMHGSTGFTLLLPTYMKGVELQHKTQQWNLNETRREITYGKGPGIRFHQVFSIWSKGNKAFFAGISAGWISALRKSRTLISGDMSLPVSQRELKYLTGSQISEKGKINDPSLSGFNADLPMETQTYNEALSFVAIKMGLVYYLNKQ
jgi:hypothetical protein